MNANIKSSVLSAQWSVTAKGRSFGGSASVPTAAACTTTRSRRSVALQVTFLALTLCASTTFAGTLVTSSIDGGGQRATSASYTMDGSVGGIAGISTVASPPETAKHGYIGQLTEVVSMSATGTPAFVNETATSQLSGTATLDDSSVTALNGGDISWVPPVYPVALIDGSGLATASAVYASTNGTFAGSYLGTSGSGQLFVIDSIADNYGLYAGDTVSDSWQVQYFGVNNPKGMGSADADGTGQNNLFKYTAGLDPTNPASVFILKIASVTGQPTQKNLIFKPWASGRTYTTEYRTNLVFGSYGTLTGYGGPQTNITEVTVTDLNAVEQQKFYRIRISYP